MPAINLLEKLDGTQTTKRSTKGVTVKTELEQLWTLGTLQKKKETGITSKYYIGQEMSL